MDSEAMIDDGRAQDAMMDHGAKTAAAATAAATARMAGNPPDPGL
jgi:hypothetical protein